MDKYTVNMRSGFGWTDWRCIYGTIEPEVKPSFMYKLWNTFYKYIGRHIVG